VINPVKSDLLAEVANYYTAKLAAYGETPRGVDWNGEESQLLRFKQLCKIINSSEHFSLNDLGCGYGALLDFLTSYRSSFSYAGFDVAESMVQAASLRHKGIARARFVKASAPDIAADYGIASGIFNVRMERSDVEWRSFLEQTLDALDRTSSIGFAFNCLTAYSDEEKKRDYLYYPDPCALFDICKRRYSRDVALLHDYGLYEFTILVRKSA
jgi:SAM-dependent methyltransferase